MLGVLKVRLGPLALLADSFRRRHLNELVTLVIEWDPAELHHTAVLQGQVDGPCGEELFDVVSAETAGAKSDKEGHVSKPNNEPFK